MPRQTNKSKSLSAWLRITALLVLVSFGSVAQAVHTHDADISHPGKQHTSDADCPICLAMHAVTVTQQQTLSVPLVLRRVRFNLTVSRRPDFPWRSKLASRPPPASDIATDVRQGVTSLAI